jgi:hypothetical protein
MPKKSKHEHIRLADLPFTKEGEQRYELALRQMRRGAAREGEKVKNRSEAAALLGVLLKEAVIEAISLDALWVDDPPDIATDSPEFAARCRAEFIEYCTSTFDKGWKALMVDDQEPQTEV